MKTDLIKFTTQSIKNLRGILAGLIATLIFFNLLPKAWGVDLFWEGNATSPATAGSGTWTTSTGTFGGSWSSTPTSNTNNPWAQGSVAHFLGSGGGAVTIGTDSILAEGVNFDPGANSFAIDETGQLAVQGAGIVNTSGKTQTINNGVGGTLIVGFNSTSTVGSVTINNNSGVFTNNGFTRGGETNFDFNSTAGSATINNNGSNLGDGGFTLFLNGSNAGSATITNNASATAGASTSFFDSNASSATIINKGAPSSGFLAGETSFAGASNAGSAKIMNNASEVSGGASGSTTFSDTSTAGSAMITNDGGAVSGANGGSTTFSGTSSAGSATITNSSRLAPNPGSLTAFGGSAQFNDSSTAGSGTIINAGSAVSDPGFGGLTLFIATSNAGSAIISNDSGTVNGGGGGTTQFFSNSNAASATITNFGGAASGERGGSTLFLGSSNAANATIITDGGTGGGGGGLTMFEGTSDGGTASAITNGNGSFDISALTSAGLGIGSIEGSGNYFLGSKMLTVGGNNSSTPVSGVIQDGGASGGTGGSLTKIGSGTLTLSGANTYSGGTNLNGGTLAVNSDGNLGTGALSFNGGTLEALAAGGGIVSGKAITLNSAGGTFLADAGTASTLSGTITGTGSWTMIGPGTLTLSGANTYSGGTNLNGGILIANSNSAISNGPIVVNGSTSIFRVNNGITLEVTPEVDNAGTVDNLGNITAGVTSTTGGGKVINENTGQISNASGDAISFDSGGSVTNSAGGQISGRIFIQGGFGTVTNSGVISSSDADAVDLEAGGSVTNFAGGKIQSTGNGVVAVLVQGGPANITNSGTIQTTGGGVGIGALSIGGTANITNSGTISGNFGVVVFGGGTVTNNAGGTIQGTDEAGVEAPGMVAIDTFSGSGQPLTVVNSGSISGAVGVILAPGGSVTNNARGVITGTSGVAIAALGGATTVSNAGAINGSVTLDNTVNTVHLFTGSTIAGSLNLGSNTQSQLILDGSGTQNLSQAVTGAIDTAGSLTKQGTGNWLIDKDLSEPVSTMIAAGSLIVDRTLTSGLVTVRSSGTLAGTGTINGSVTNFGIVSPTGTLTVAGNYTQNASGTLHIEIAGLAASQHDLLAVNGRASLAGTLQLISLGGFTLHVGDQLTFLTASGGVSGSFGTIQNELNTGTIAKAQVVTLPNAVVVEGTQGSFVQAACNPNSGAVARALDGAVGNPRASTLIAFLNNQPFNNLCGDFTLIAPEALASIFNAGVSLANVQTANLNRRMEDVRAGSNGFSSSGFTLNGGALSFGGGLAGVTGPEGKSGPPVMAPTPENRWGVWVTGIGEFANVSSTNEAAGFDIQTGGVTFGVDYRVCPIFAVGLTAGYANINGDLPNGGNLDVNSGQLGFYATLFGRGFYADAALTGGPSGYDTRRTALLGSANGSTDGGNLNALIAVGYDWTKDGLSIGPTANFQYSYVDVSGFTESGSLAPLKIDNQNVESERTALGMKASHEWKVGHVIIKPEVSAAWQHEFGAQSYSIVSSFANGAGNSFTVNSPQIGRDSLLIGAGATVLLSERVSIYAYYDGELLRSNYQSNSVSAGVRMTF